MKPFLITVNVYEEEKSHVVTADSESEAEEIVRNYWENDLSLEIVWIEEITEKEVIITK